MAATVHIVIYFWSVLWIIGQLWLLATVIFICVFGTQFLKHSKHWHEIDRCDYQQRTAGLINIYAGVLGADQFYAGNYGYGVGKLLTLGGMGWWAIADIFMWASGGHYATKGCPVV